MQFLKLYALFLFVVNQGFVRYFCTFLEMNFDVYNTFLEINFGIYYTFLEINILNVTLFWR